MGKSIQCCFCSKVIDLCVKNGHADISKHNILFFMQVCFQICLVFSRGNETDSGKIIVSVKRLRSLAVKHFSSTLYRPAQIYTIVLAYSIGVIQWLHFPARTNMYSPGVGENEEKAFTNNICVASLRARGPELWLCALPVSYDPLLMGSTQSIPAPSLSTPSVPFIYEQTSPMSLFPPTHRPYINIALRSCVYNW